MTATTQRLIGVLELASKYRYGLTAHGVPLYLFRPYDEAQPEFIVGSKSRDMSHNQIALVDVPSTAESLPPPPAKPRGALVRLIGPVGDPAAEREGLLLHYCAARHKSGESSQTLLPPSSLEDIDRMYEISAESGWITFHVDPPGCRDIDDAIAYHPATDRLAITIADAAAAVPAGSAIDATARAIGSTFYDLEGRAIIPMLPAAISEDSASLLPGQRRRGLSLIMEPDKPDRFVTSWITVNHSFTYDNFLCSPMAAQLGLDTETDAHVCIEKWMVYYNRVAATLLANHLQGVLRVQSAADAEKVAAWPSSLAHMAKEAAVYAPATDTTGHSSLGMDYYTHATSPLRRYADLVNQRCLKAILHPTTAAAVAAVTPDDIATLNARSKANKRWTRDLTFLTHVIPGHVHEIDIVWVDPAARRVWVPQWGRLLRIRHEPPATAEAGTAGRIQIFCDPTRRNWKQRILTAPCGPATTTINHPAPAATLPPL